MKTVFFLLILTISVFFIPKSSIASTTNEFQYETKLMQQELIELEIISQFVEINDLTYSQLKEVNKYFANKLTYSKLGKFGIKVLEPTKNTPSVFLGFCCGPLGILFTVIVYKDEDETKKATLGCILGSILSVGYYLFRTL